MIMKKFLMIILMTLMFGMNVNAHEVKLVDNVKIELMNNDNLTIDSISINHSINRYLNLKDDQDWFYDIHRNLYDYIKLLSQKHESVMKEFNLNLANDLRLSKMILDNTQYKKYLLVVNQTLNNNDLTKYITKE